MTGGKLKMESREFGSEEWNALVSGMDALSLMQTWEFAEAKARTGNWGVSRAIFRGGTETVAAVQCVIRKLPLVNRGLVWVNRAPLFADGAGEDAETRVAVLDELRRYWTRRKKMYLRMAPPFAASEANYAMLERAGYSRALTTDGWASDLLDLTMTEDALRKNLDGKWRNMLSKAERSGVSCEIGSTPELMAELMNDYAALLERIGPEASLSPSILTALQSLLPADRKMVVLAAREGGRKLGSILIALYGETSMYLVGAVNEEGRKLNANYHLIWNAIREMKWRGFKWLDLGGVHPDLTPPGVLHFKRGAGGTPYRLMGDVDAGGDRWINRMIRSRIGNG